MDSCPPAYGIHHYPTEWIETRVQADAPRLTLRPILPQDAGPLDVLMRGLNPEDRRRRFHGVVKLSSARLQEMACVDFRRHLALVVTTAAGSGGERLIADARYVVDADGLGAEFALVVDAEWQRRGVGAWAMRTLQEAATHGGLQWLHGEVLHDNTPMLGLMRRCGFILSPDPEDDGLLRVQRRVGRHAVTPTPARVGALSWLRSAWAHRNTGRPHNTTKIQDLQKARPS
jgi:GNAT superfamily N-acetyltransferase